MPLLRCALVFALTLALAPAVAAQGHGGRPIRLNGVRPLAFGDLIAGVPMNVLRTDAARAGQFDLTAQNSETVILDFSLPVVMNGPGGASMPITFAATDAGWSQAQSIGSQVPFDPHQPYLATMSRQGRGSIFLGGTVTPAASQAPGSYSATVTLTVVYP